jgi:hypothetical protein
MLQNKLMMNGICAMPSAMAAQRIHVFKFHDGARQRVNRVRHARGGIIRAAVGHAAQHALDALREHRHEDEVHEHQRAPEMHPAPEFIHLPPGHFGKPE